jgi:hypothetical protein
MRTAGVCCLAFWAGQMKEIGELIVYGQESLRLSRRFELLRDPLPSSRRLMRFFGPVVQAFVLAMLDFRPALSR